jgi:hypothetical protein
VFSRGVLDRYKSFVVESDPAIEMLLNLGPFEKDGCTALERLAMRPEATVHSSMLDVAPDQDVSARGDPRRWQMPAQFQLKLP